MSNEAVGHVESLIAKAAKSDEADSAMKFAQAACNAAKALCDLAFMKSQQK